MLRRCLSMTHGVPVPRDCLDMKKAWRRMNLLEPWLWKTKYNNKHKRPTPIAGRECSPYPRCILKIFQIFGSENKS